MNQYIPIQFEGMRKASLKKECLVCETAFFKPTGYSYKQWEGKRFCSKKCGLIAIGKDPNKSYEERFWEKVLIPEDRSKCWVWTAMNDQYGYGRFNVNGKPILAHRYSWEIEKGPLLKGMMVRHICDNPSCVNPNHLRLGTAQENSDDCNKNNRQGKKGSRLDPRLVKVLYLAIKAGADKKELQEAAQVSRDTIKRIANKQTRQSVFDEWGYNG